MSFCVLFVKLFHNLCTMEFCPEWMVSLYWALLKPWQYRTVVNITRTFSSCVFQLTSSVLHFQFQLLHGQFVFSTCMIGSPVLTCIVSDVIHFMYTSAQVFIASDIWKTQSLQFDSFSIYDRGLTIGMFSFKCVVITMAFGGN